METHRVTEKRPITIDDLIRLSHRLIRQIAVSPDDEYAAVVTDENTNQYPDYSRDIMRRSLWLLSRDTSTQRILSQSDAHSPAWSPDGNNIAYLGRASGSTQIWSVNLEDDQHLQITNIPERNDNIFAFSRLTWTPDGRRIIFTAARPQITWPHPELVADFKNPVQVESTLINNRPQSMQSFQLWSVDVSGGEPDLLTSIADGSCNFIGWRKGDLLLFCGERIYSYSSSNKQTRLLLKKQHCLSSIDQSGSLWLVSEEQNELVLLRIEDDDTINEVSRLQDTSDEEIPKVLLPDLKKLYSQCRRGVESQLVEYDLHSGTRRVLTNPGEVVASDWNRFDLLSSPTAGSLWFPLSTISHPAEIHVIDRDKGHRRVSCLHPDADELDIPEVRKLIWQSDGWDIEGLVVLPTTLGDEGGYPTLVFLQGGPGFEVQASFDSLNALHSHRAAYYFAASGFAVLAVNFRGCRSYGEEFRKQLGSYHIFDRPFADVMAGVDYLVERGIADPERLGVYGHSYGAELTAWILGHTSRFKGAVAACGRYDHEAHARYSEMPFVSQNSSCMEGTNTEEIWRNPDVWSKLSPMEHIMNITTPLLIFETSAERKGGQEARPFFNTLRALGVEAYDVFCAYHSRSSGFLT